MWRVNHHPSWVSIVHIRRSCTCWNNRLWLLVSVLCKSIYLPEKFGTSIVLLQYMMVFDQCQLQVTSASMAGLASSYWYMKSKLKWYLYFHVLACRSKLTSKCGLEPRLLWIPCLDGHSGSLARPKLKVHHGALTHSITCAVFLNIYIYKCVCVCWNTSLTNQMHAMTMLAWETILNKPATPTRHYFSLGKECHMQKNIKPKLYAHSIPCNK